MKVTASIILASSLAVSAGEIHKGMTESQVRQQYGNPIAVEPLSSGTRLTFPGEGIGKMMIPFHQMTYITVDLNSSHRVKSYRFE